MAADKRSGPAPAASETGALGIGPLLRPVLAPLGGGLGFSVFLNLLALVLPLHMMQVYGRVVPTRHLETLFFLTGLALFALAVSAALDCLRSRVLGRIGTWLAAGLAPAVISALLRAKARGVADRHGQRGRTQTPPRPTSRRRRLHRRKPRRPNPGPHHPRSRNPGPAGASGGAG